MSLLLINALIGVSSAVGFTLFQASTLQVDLSLWSIRFYSVTSLNFFYSYLTWLNLRSVDNASMTLQMMLGFGRAFVSWLSFATISRRGDSNLTKKQFAGFLVSIALTMLSELNKRLNL